MLELLNAAVSPANIIATTLLIIVLIYWLAVIIGIVDLDAFDLHLDMHHDLDMGHSGDVHFSVDWLNHILYFFNLGQIPLMIFVTFLVLPMWIISILANYYLGNSSFFLSLMLLLPNFIASLFIAKILTYPFVKLFTYMNKEEEEQEVIGKVGVAMVNICSEHIGQAKVNTKESPLLLNVKTKPGTTIQAGETGLIVEYFQDRNIYLIEPFEN